VPVAVPTTQPTIKPPLSSRQIAAAFGLQPANRRIARGDFVIRLKQPKGITIKRAVVLFSGKSVTVEQAGARWVAHRQPPPLHQAHVHDHDPHHDG
jgi:hypothetical protein